MSAGLPLHRSSQAGTTGSTGSIGTTGTTNLADIGAQVPTIASNTMFLIGLGLLLVRNAAAHIHYERTRQNKNRITVRIAA